MNFVLKIMVPLAVAIMVEVLFFFRGYRTVTWKPSPRPRTLNLNIPRDVLSVTLNYGLILISDPE